MLASIVSSVRRVSGARCLSSVGPSPVHWLRLHAPVSSEARAQGWVRSVRRQKGVTFLEVNDGSCVKSLQVVVDAEGTTNATSTPVPAGHANPGNASGGGGSAGSAVVTGTLTAGCSVDVRGVVVASPNAAQRVEVRATSVRVIWDCDAAAYPLQKKVGFSVCWWK